MTTLLSIQFLSSSWQQEILRVPRMQGIYRLYNTVNGKSYVGSSKDIRARWRTHLRAFEGRGVCGQKYLTSAWRKHGAGAFVFEILESVTDGSHLLVAEQKWIDSLQSNSDNNGYNLRKIAASNYGMRLPQSEESKLKISAANKGRRYPDRPHWLRGKNHSEYSRSEMSRTKRARISGLIEFNGRAMCLSDWADTLGITMRALGNRLHRRWPIERALTESSRGY